MNTDPKKPKVSAVPDDPPPPTAAEGGTDRGPLAPSWFLRTVAYAGGTLVVGTVVWVIVWALLQVALVTFALIVALLLAALLAPLARLIHRFLPAWAAALLSLLLLLGVVSGFGYLLTRRVTAQLDNLVSSLTASINQIENWLVRGPLGLAPQTVAQVRVQIVNALQSAAPSGVAAAAIIISVASGVVIALFVLFFLLKDGTAMWSWLVATVPARNRHRVEEAGRLAWETASRYVVGVVIIAMIDAVLIGIALFALGVPLAISLSVLIFFGAFVPFLGAILSGLVAVLVTLVTNGIFAALIVLGVVLFVQNLEGNLLAPLIQGHRLALHPVVILVVVTVGYLVFGIPGAVVAVPLVAVCYRVGSYLRQTTPRAGHRRGLEVD